VDFSACQPKSPPFFWTGFWQISGAIVDTVIHPMSIIDAIRDIPVPAKPEAMKEELDCEQREKIARNEKLIADITPDSTGELYVYVNDAVLFWDSRDHHKFYKNNSGKAKVTVTRTVAPATIDFNSAEGG
jgi:hypothetical protein